MVETTSYPGWNKHPCYRVKDSRDWIEVCMWMYKNKVEHFLLSSGSSGYTFQVTENHHWFALRWL